MKFFLSLLVGMSLGSINAQTFSSRDGFTFLGFSPTARHYVLGSLVAVKDEWNSYSNPANIAFASKAGLSFDRHALYFDEWTQSYWSGGFDFGRYGVVGVSVNHLSEGKVAITTEESPGGGIGYIHPFERSIGLTYAYKISRFVSAGVTLMRVVRDWDFLSIHANYVDMGVLADIPLQSINYEAYKNQILLGLSMTNVGLGKPSFKNYIDLLNESPFETNHRINTGLTYRFFQKSDLKKYEDFSIMISPSFTSVPHERNRAYVGFQATWIEILSIYTGTKNYAKSSAASSNMQKESLGDRWGCDINLPLKRLTALSSDITINVGYAQGDETIKNKRYYHISISGNWN